MREIIREQVSIKSEGDIWVIDLDENCLPYDQEELTQMFIGEQSDYLGYKFVIEDVKFFKYVKNKFVLIATQL